MRADPDPASGDLENEGRPGHSIPRLWLLAAAVALAGFGAWALIPKIKPAPAKTAEPRAAQTQAAPAAAPAASPAAPPAVRPTAPDSLAEAPAKQQEPSSKADAALLQQSPPIAPQFDDPGFQSLPESFKPLVKQAEAVFKARDFTAAEKLYRQVAEANPENHFILANLGATLLEIGKIDEAEFVIRKAPEKFAR